MRADWSEAAREKVRAKLPVVVEGIAAPPCPICFHWQPVAISDAEGRYAGIRLCHGIMLPDFSCFYQAPERANGEAR